MRRRDVRLYCKLTSQLDLVIRQNKVIIGGVKANAEDLHADYFES